MADIDFSGKVAIITGASSGFGQATAILFARKGASLALCGRDQSRLEATKALCVTESGGQVDRFICVQGDLNDAAVRQSIVDKTVQTFKHLDILVANAGVHLPGEDVDNATEEIFDKIFNTNVKSPFFLIKCAIPHLVKSKGNVVSVSSLVSTTVLSKSAVYPMSKASVDHMVRCLALDLGPRGVRVNCVNPSFAPTRMQRDYGDKADDVTNMVVALESPKHIINAGYCITAEDVAQNIAFLASDAAKSITGHCQIVDNGRRYTGQLVL